MDNDLERTLAWAEWIGAHAMPLFAVALLALWVGAAVAVVSIRRYGGRIAKGPLPRMVLLSLRFAIGAGMLMATAALFAEMMDALDTDDEIGQFDVRLTETLSRELSASTLRFFGAVTHLGDPMPLTLLVIAVAVLLIARRQTSLAFAWSAACAGGAVLNRVLKQIFERVRPVHDHGFASADGFSFPSGHTSGSVVVYGMLAYLCVRLLPSRWHLPGALLAATLAFSTAWSRVFLQVHWASDVVAGFAVGFAWLTVCIAALEMARRYARA